MSNLIEDFIRGPSHYDDHNDYYDDDCYERRRKDICERVRILEERLRRLEDRTQQDISELRREINAINVRLNNLEAEFAAFKTEVQESIDRIENLIVEVERQVQELEVRVNELDRKVEDNIVAIDALEIRVVRHEEQITVLQEQVEEHTNEISRLSASVENNTEQIELLRQDTESNTEAIQTLTQDVVQNTADIAELRADVQELAVTVASLREVVELDRQRIEQLEADFGTLEQEVGDLIMGQRRLDDEIIRLDVTVTELNEEVARLREDNENLRVTVLQLTQRVDDVESTSNQNTESIANLDLRVGFHQAEITNLDARVTALENNDSFVSIPTNAPTSIPLAQPLDDIKVDVSEFADADVHGFSWDGKKFIAPCDCEFSSVRDYYNHELHRTICPLHKTSTVQLIEHVFTPLQMSQFDCDGHLVFPKQTNFKYDCGKGINARMARKGLLVHELKSAVSYNNSNHKKQHYVDPVGVQFVVPQNYTPGSNIKMQVNFVIQSDMNANTMDRVIVENSRDGDKVDCEIRDYVRFMATLDALNQCQPKKCCNVPFNRSLELPTRSGVERPPQSSCGCSKTDKSEKEPSPPINPGHYHSFCDDKYLATTLGKTIAVSQLQTVNNDGLIHYSTTLTFEDLSNDNDFLVYPGSTLYLNLTRIAPDDELRDSPLPVGIVGLTISYAKSIFEPPHVISKSLKTSFSDESLKVFKTTLTNGFY